jgi:hypothetical protein
MAEPARSSVVTVDDSPSGCHAPDCSCTRCVGFTPGPDGTALANRRHGAYSIVEIQGRSAEVAEGLRVALREEGLYRPGFEPALALCSVVLVRVERAAAAIAATDATLDEAGVSPLAPFLDSERGLAMEKLRRELRRWTAEARTHLTELGLTPRSLAALSRDAGSALRARSALSNLSAHLETAHSEDLE